MLQVMNYVHVLMVVTSLFVCVAKLGKEGNVNVVNGSRYGMPAWKIILRMFKWSFDYSIITVLVLSLAFYCIFIM